MSKGFTLDIQVLDLEKSVAIVKYVASQRERWGKHYTADDIGTEKLLDALVILGDALEAKEEVKSEEVTKLKRQLAAATAREARAKKAKSGD